MQWFQVVWCELAGVGLASLHNMLISQQNPMALFTNKSDQAGKNETIITQPRDSICLVFRKKPDLFLKFWV